MAPRAAGVRYPVRSALTNPLLGALANNGGSTPTFALLTSSPAIDGVTFSAPNGAPSTDQRGVARPQGVRYDIGAFEGSATQAGPAFIVNASADTNDGFCDVLGQGIGNHDCTLREAINAANALAGANTITFSVSGTITLCLNTAGHHRCSRADDGWRRANADHQRE